MLWRRELEVGEPDAASFPTMLGAGEQVVVHASAFTVAEDVGELARGAWAPCGARRAAPESGGPGRRCPW
jgi:hypothetical protein